MNMFLQHQTNTTSQQSFTGVRMPILQRQCACGQHSGGGECAECSNEQKQTLQRAAINTAPTPAVPPIVHDVLSSPGQSLGAGTRAFMEPRFGYDFSGVRVHTDARAAESARAVNALAYTVGRDVVFGAGEYRPASTMGRRLLAHELAHVVQNDKTGSAVHPDSITPAVHPSEQQAEAASIQGRNASALSAAPVGLALKRESSSPGSSDVVFKENEGSTIVKGRADPQADHDERVLDGQALAVTKGLVYLTTYYSKMLTAVNDFKDDAQRKIEAMKGDPSGYYSLLPKLVDSLIDVLRAEFPIITTTAAIFAKFVYSSIHNLEITHLKEESGDAKKEARHAMLELANVMKTQQTAVVNDMTSELKDVILSITDENVENLLASKSIDAALQAIGLPDPTKHSPYRPIREALDVEFAEWLIHQEYRARQGRFFPARSRFDIEEERVEEMRRVGPARREARENVKKIAEERHEPE